MSIAELRHEYHRRICCDIIRIMQPGKSKGHGKKKEPYPNFADGDNKSSTSIAWGIIRRMKCSGTGSIVTGQAAGSLFESITKDFLERAFPRLEHLRPGKWVYPIAGDISSFEQYEHLAYLERVVKHDKDLSSVLGVDYIVKPDILIGRCPVPDRELGGPQKVIRTGDPLAKLTPLRKRNRGEPHPILHASISCKWTIRSDRAQNTRTEALNLIRNRKGPQPHIVAVTAEPLPTRIATLALGTGDLDCVYHFALQELREAIRDADNQDQSDMLETMIQGRRLRDISDLPFDLAI